MRKPVLTTLFCLLVVCTYTAPLTATPDVPYITGTSTATLITGGPHDGWYRYDISINWDLNTLGAGLSHWDIIFKADCGMSAELVDFDSPAGYSYPADPPIEWDALFESKGDPDLVTPITTPVIKYNEPTAEPGVEGNGTFWFYADFAPVYGTYTNALVAKAGTVGGTYGDLTGDTPPCTIPEPATILLFGLGALTLLRKRRA